MDFFSKFYNLVQNNIVGMISSITSDISASISPAVVTFATIYVMIWGNLHLRGAIEEPIGEGAKRILTLAVILGICLNLWEYNAVMVDFFINTPTALGGAILGGNSAMATIDGIWQKGATIATSLISQGGILNNHFAFYLAGFIVYLIAGVICLWTTFIFSLALFAVGGILAVGPLFIMALLFDATKRFFEGWMAQLSNYALITIIASVFAKIMLNFLDTYAVQANALGAGITIADAAQFCLACGMTILMMKQVPSIAAGLASGVALSTFNTMSRGINWGMNKASGTMYQTVRGVGDAIGKQDPSRYLPTTRNMANRVARPIVNRFSKSEEKTGGKIANK